MSLNYTNLLLTKNRLFLHGTHLLVFSKIWLWGGDVVKVEQDRAFCEEKERLRDVRKKHYLRRTNGRERERERLGGYMFFQLLSCNCKYVCMYKVSLQEKQTPNGTPCAMDARNHNAWNLVCIIMFPLLPPQRYGTWHALQWVYLFGFCGNWWHWPKHPW